MRSREILLGLLISLAGVLIVWGFSLLPLDSSGLAVDWKLFYDATHGLRIAYFGNRVYNPPWVLALLWPLIILPLGLSRGLAALTTLSVFFISVPRISNRLIWGMSVILLMFSYPMLRHLIDGNLEAMIVGGVLLALLAKEKKSVMLMAASIILLSAKLQESWLFLVILMLLLWRDWPRSSMLRVWLVIALFVSPFLLWKGADWLHALQLFPYSKTAIDSSLLGILAKLGVPLWFSWLIIVVLLGITLWLVLAPTISLDTLRAGFLITAGLMLSNYVAGDSLVTVLALAVIPFFQRKPIIGFFIAALYFLPFGFIPFAQFRLAWENVYWAFVLLVTWGVLAFSLIQHRRQSISPIAP